MFAVFLFCYQCSFTSAYGKNFVGGGGGGRWGLGGLNVICPNETCWSQMQEDDSFVTSP